MSRQSDLPNDTQSAKRYVARLIGTGIFKEIWLQGSRSPLREKQPHKHSDWDFGVVTDSNWKVPQPRIINVLHADLSYVTDSKYLHPKAVMLYPKDTHGVFDD